MRIMSSILYSVSSKFIYFLIKRYFFLEQAFGEPPAAKSKYVMEDFSIEQLLPKCLLKVNAVLKCPWKTCHSVFFDLAHENFKSETVRRCCIKWKNAFYIWYNMAIRKKKWSEKLSYCHFLGPHPLLCLQQVLIVKSQKHASIILCFLIIFFVLEVTPCQTF